MKTHYLFFMLVTLYITVHAEESKAINTPQMQYLRKREKSAKVGAVFHYTSFVRYPCLLLMFEPDSDDNSSETENDDDNIGAFAGLAYVVGSGRKIHGDIQAGIAATRACRYYNEHYKTTEKFSWRYYAIGVGSFWGSLGLSAIATRHTKSSRVPTAMIVAGITACEVLTTIHIVKARRITQRLTTQSQEKSAQVSWGISPLLTSQGGGLAFSLNF